MRPIGRARGKPDISSRREGYCMNQGPPRNVPNRDLLRVADLDSEYQEAVKKNDSVTMNRILADDFVLITGTGKVFTKTKMDIPTPGNSDPATRRLKAKNILEKTARKIPTCVRRSSPLTPNMSFSSWPRYRSDSVTRIMAKIEPTKNQAVISDW